MQKLEIAHSSLVFNIKERTIFLLKNIRFYTLFLGETDFGIKTLIPRKNCISWNLYVYLFLEIKLIYIKLYKGIPNTC